MQEIVTSRKLIEIAADQGVFMTDYEASLIIGYMNGHEYSLVVDEKGKMYRMDEQEDGESDEEYSVEEAIVFAAEMNDSLQEENQNDQAYLKELQDDEKILNSLYAFLHPADGKCRYNVEITETMQKTVSVVAATPEEAHRIVNDRWSSGYYTLDADNFVGVDFEVQPQDGGEDNGMR